jgi:hypothetical protein
MTTCTLPWTTVPGSPTWRSTPTRARRRWLASPLGRWPSMPVWGLVSSGS